MFEFIFKTVLGYVSGDQMGSFEAKKRSRKSHAWAPLTSAFVRSARESTVAMMAGFGYVHRVQSGHRQSLNS
jgi:hypothetical protein